MYSSSVTCLLGYPWGCLSELPGRTKSQLLTVVPGSLHWPPSLPSLLPHNLPLALELLSEGQLLGTPTYNRLWSIVKKSFEVSESQFPHVSDGNDDFLTGLLCYVLSQGPGEQQAFRKTPAGSLISIKGAVMDLGSEYCEGPWRIRMLSLD